MSDLERLSIDAIRVLSMDAVQAANSGHPGAPMGLADVEKIPFAYDEALDAQGLLENEDTIRNIRLLDPGVVNDTYQRLQAERGFYQFQCVLTRDSGEQGLRRLLEGIAASGKASFLAVLKTLGGPGVGCLSFPM